MSRNEHSRTCSWCGSGRATVPDIREGRRTGRRVCSDRGDAEHPRTACFLPWFLGVEPEQFRAQLAESPSLASAAAEEVDELTPRLAAVVVALRRHGWVLHAREVRTLAWQLRDVPEVRASVAAALGSTDGRR